MKKKYYFGFNDKVVILSANNLKEAKIKFNEFIKKENK